MSNTATHATARPVELELAKAAGRVHATVGETITFHLAVTNHGPSQATGVEVRDQLPTGLQFLAAQPDTGHHDPATGIWSIDTLPVGGTATLQLRAKITQPGTFYNTATATANETSTDTTSTGTGVDGGPTSGPVYQPVTPGWPGVGEQPVYAGQSPTRCACYCLC
ncbi:DUF11 domain-containing protein [Actinomadura sp. NTSP31]|uniref:DUF11 domain-containing protein n=1 Tax=Actinomadura sp. NTSP31 TaxID=1735447 RepID=UPI0035BEF785